MKLATAATATLTNSSRITCLTLKVSTLIRIPAPYLINELNNFVRIKPHEKDITKFMLEIVKLSENKL